MGIDWLRPWFLLLLPLVWFPLYRWWRSTRRVTGLRKNLITGTRATVVTLLVLALAGTTLLFPDPGQTVVFVVDRSASMVQDGRAAQFIREAVAGKGPEDRFAVVAVGAQAAVEQPVTQEGQVAPLGAVVDAHATDLAAGLRLAGALVASGQRGRVVVLSDGRETRGDGAREARLLTQRGIRVDGVALGQEEGPEVQVSELSLPNRLYQGERFSLRVRLDSREAVPARLHIYEGQRLVLEQEVQLERGANRYAFSLQAGEGGFHRYRVAVMPLANADQRRENNEAFAFALVTGIPRVLVIEGHPGAAANLAAALRAGGMAVELRSPTGLPTRPEAYQSYGSVILADVPATAVSDGVMEILRDGVRDQGRGLIMTGGSQSFGLGGWFETLVEEALPVNMEIKNKERMPSLALILVIDKSGSMADMLGGPSKMELAKEAARRAIDLLEPKDQLGVVAFDSEPWWVIEPTAVEDRQALDQAVGSIMADGGTNIYPALATAYEAMLDLEAQRKHIILLTDGMSAGYSFYGSLLEYMGKAGITLSTVAVGANADVGLLENLARQGNGRSYVTSDSTEIPKIFSKEATLATRSYIVNQPQAPRLGSVGGEHLFPGGIPRLEAYVATSPKATAEQILISAEPDPILARWQYGLGRALAWTSDLEGRWSGNWVQWEGNAAFWAQMVGWTLPQYSQGPWDAEVSQGPEGGVIRVNVPPGQLGEGLTAQVQGPDNASTSVPLLPVGPDCWEGRFPAGQPGVYLVQIQQTEGGQVKAASQHGLAISYSPEYDAFKGEGSHLETMVEAGQGQLLQEPAQAFRSGLAPQWGQQDISLWLLALAAFLWPVDVALRRLAWPRRRQGQKAAAPAGPWDILRHKQERLRTRRQPSPVVPLAAADTPGVKAETLAEQTPPLVSSHPIKPTPSTSSPVPPIPSQGSQAGDGLQRLLRAKERARQNQPDKGKEGG